MALFAGKPRADVLDGMVDYLVDTPDGAVGVLDDWGRDEHGRPTTLILAQGWFGRRRYEVPVAKLLEIDDERRHMVLARGAAPLEPRGLLQRLLGLGQVRTAEETSEAPPRHPGRARPVLCALAHDRHARSVAAVAARLAKALAAPLVLTHVIPGHAPPGVSTAPAGQERLRDEERADAGDWIDALLTHVIPDTDVRRILTRGAPARTLDEIAAQEDAQFLVVGSAGKGVLGTLLRGSVSHDLISRAPCPVVVVPPQATPYGRDEELPGGARSDVAQMTASG
jgi:nucleotide-binding universal stress UspA family protein